MTPASLPQVSSDGPVVVVGLTEDSVSAEAPITPRVDVPSRPALEVAQVVLPEESGPDLDRTRDRPSRDSEPTSLEPVEMAPEADEAAVNADEISIPPVVEAIAIEAAPEALPEEDEHFFQAGERLSQLPVADDDWEHPAADRLKRKSMPHVVQRRERFSRVVKWVAGGAAVLCALAAARAVVPGHAPPAAVAAKMEAPARPVEPPRVEAPKVDVPAAPVAVAAPEAEAPKDVASAAPAAPDPESAKADKKLAQKALERGKLADAIEAGERSVASDPTDGEAWLILGASYQEKGKIAEAKRCYRACIDQGKRGPKGECAAMLR